MALSDCPKCWDTPCGCGHEWSRWSLEKLVEFRTMIDRIIAAKQEAAKASAPKGWKAKGPEAWE